MKPSRFSALCSALAGAAALFAWVPAVALAASPAPMQASHLMGLHVVDGRGHDLGEVTDLLVDLQAKRLLAVVVERGTASGSDVQKVFAWPGPTERNGKLVVDAGASTTDVQAAGSGTALPFTRIAHTPLRDAEGQSAGEVADLMVLPDAQVASVLVKFAPEWAAIDGLAAVSPASVERKGDGFLAKFRSEDVRPATQGAKPARPAPAAAAAPPAAPRARLARLPGAPVADPSGKQVAILDDVLIDSKGRRIAALVLRAGEQRMQVAFPQPGLRFEAGRLVASGGVDALSKAPAGGLKSARQLLDMRIRSVEGDNVGEVEDVVADMDKGSLQFAVAKFDPNWVAPDWLVALPLRAATPDEGGHAAMRFDLSEINRAYLFPAKSWPDFSNAAVRAAIHSKIDRL
jgi:sporulation protein YlmC with PRC-barrel domain